ncbi:hypothetical protein CDAR_481981 [Caerostris darwini]|uniref:Uncharacterized protein n=1 Tax=Caerostris darwini TaxID=1538125 RepID=A0AAV4TJS1_9ARAC|nr:hypothetical protein CDAR_481981 [Caerostris darwini]
MVAVNVLYVPSLHKENNQFTRWRREQFREATTGGRANRFGGQSGFYPYPSLSLSPESGKKNKKRGKDRDILPNKTANSFMGSKNARNLCPRVFLT